MRPKPKSRPEHWSLEKAKKDQAKVTTFDQGQPKLGAPNVRERTSQPASKERGKDGKFTGKPA